MLDIKALLEAIKNIFSAAYQNTKPEVLSVIADYTVSAEIRLVQLSQQALLGRDNGGIDKDFLIERLKDEKDIMANQLLSLQIIAEAEVQALANSTIEILTLAIIAALPKPSQQ